MNRNTKRGLLVAAIALFALAASTPAAAHDRHHKSKKHHRGHRHEIHRHLDRYDSYRAVPRRIHGRSHRMYAPYDHGRVYHRRHGHFHRVYRFPVVSDRRIVYRPYAYCGESLDYDSRAVLPPLAYDLSVDYYGPRFELHLRR